MARNLLIINGHQRWDIASGSLNSSLVSIAREGLVRHGWAVRTTTVEEGYDVADELDRIEWATAIVLQFPVYWFSTPWALKKYIDTVFTGGRGRIYLNDGRSSSDPSRRYGSGGALKDRCYMISTTWNAPKGAFGNPQEIFRGGDIDDVFLGIHVALQFLGLSPLPSFSCHDVIKNGRIDEDLKRFADHIDRVFGP